MDTSLKLQILIWLFTLGVLMVATMIILQTLGHLSYLLEHIERIVEKESLIRVDKISRQAAKEHHNQKMEDERKRRSEALLSMPLMMEKGSDNRL